MNNPSIHAATDPVDNQPDPGQSHPPLAQASPHQTQTLRNCVATTLNNYFQHLDGQPVTNIYQMVLSEVEAPLLEEVMKYTRNNQTRASQLLGLNRGTLRKKMKQYGLL